MSRYGAGKGGESSVQPPLPRPAPSAGEPDLPPGRASGVAAGGATARLPGFSRRGWGAAPAPTLCGRRTGGRPMWPRGPGAGDRKDAGRARGWRGKVPGHGGAAASLSRRPPALVRASPARQSPPRRPGLPEAASGAHHGHRGGGNADRLPRRAAPSRRRSAARPAPPASRRAAWTRHRPRRERARRGAESGPRGSALHGDRRERWPYPVSSGQPWSYLVWLSSGRSVLMTRPFIFLLFS